MKDASNNLPINWEDIEKTIFELRYYKLRGLIDYYNNNNNVVFVSLEYLQDDKNAIIFLDALNLAFQLDHAGDYSLITQHTKVNQQIKNRQYDIDISAHRELINAKKDDDIEDFVDHLEFIIKTDDDQIIPIHSKDSVVSEYLPK